MTASTSAVHNGTRHPEKHPRFVLQDEDHDEEESIEHTFPPTIERANNDGPIRIVVEPTSPIENNHQRNDSADLKGATKHNNSNQYGGQSANGLNEKGAQEKAPAENASTPIPPKHKFLHYLMEAIEPLIGWTKPRMNWKGWRPVIRASIASWAGLILMLAGPSQRMLGQASFLVGIVSIISPAAYPITTMLELTFFQFLLVGCSWAYSALGLYIAHISRRRYRYTVAEFQAIAGQDFVAQGVAGYDISTFIQDRIFHGAYLEPTSSAVCAIFLGIGVGFLLWLRQRLGPGPILFGIIFAIIIQIICFTIAVLFPYYYASVGLVFFLPFTCQQAIQLAATFLILPETLGHQFSDRLIATLTPLKAVIRQQKVMLNTNPRSNDWLQHKSIKQAVTGAMGSLTLLGASEANLTRELSFGRVSGKDLSKLLKAIRVLVQRSTGFISFYEIVEKHLHRDSSTSKGGPIADELVVHLGHSRPATPIVSRPVSPSGSGHSSPHLDDENRDRRPADPHELSSALDRAGSEQRPRHLSTSRAHSHTGLFTPTHHTSSSSSSLGDLREGQIDEAHHNHLSHHNHHPHQTGGPSSKRRSKSRTRHHHGHQHHKNSSSHASIPSLLHDVLHANIEVPRSTGMFEAQRYMDLEDYLHNPSDEEHLEEIMRLLASASDDLIDALIELIEHLLDAIHGFKITNSKFWRMLGGLDSKNKDGQTQDQLVAETQERIERVEKALANYRDIQRLDVIRPFAALFDPISQLGPEGIHNSSAFNAPSHRGLFWALSYQFSLISWGEALSALGKECVRIEDRRTKPRIWAPDWAKYHFASSAEATFEEEHPESIELINRSQFRSPRDPDHRPPKTLGDLIGVEIDRFLCFFVRRDFLFGVKMAIVIGLCSMPAYFPTSCYFFYRERGIWPLIMIALTSTLYIGDTAFGFVIRFLGTLGGAIIGLLLWSIACQTSEGSPYALAAVMFVALFPIQFFRIYYTPVPTAIIPTVTIMLVVGYSWQGAHYPAGSSVGWGWPVAWRRMVGVTLGVTIAFIVAFLPPKVTQKVAIRQTYANVINSMGGVLCQILSFANCKDEPIAPPSLILKNIAALRAKVSKTTASKAMVRFEWSLAGKWPEQHYTALQSLQMELLDLYGQLLSVLASLDKKWTKAVLHRSQLSNPQFLGDVLTTLQLVSSALKNGTELPMIYNPLLESYLKSPETQVAHRQYGFDVALVDGDEIEGIPSHVTLDTICSMEYLKFSCGISQVYAIVNRLDRLMFVTKALVGEHYIMYGLDSFNYKPRYEGEDEERRWLNDSHTPSTRTSYDAGAGGGGM